MKHKQRKRKHKLVKEHLARQTQRKADALAAARAQDPKSTKHLIALMREQGYVSNGRGGWRPLSEPKRIDTISKA
jgi:hypothetical protein